jgi:UDP:flavonoid glycosyltransferase YjiC (YdhE family)
MREGGNYLGIFPGEEEADMPAWPGTDGKKVFAYLHPFRTMEPFFRAMSRLKLRTLAYAPELPEAVKKKLSGEYVRFVPRRLDLRKALKQADAAVTSGTYATTCAALLAGRPVLMLPQNLERIMVARRVVSLGAGIAARANQPRAFPQKLRQLVEDQSLAAAAREFAKRHAHEDQAWQTKQMLEVAGRLLDERAQWLAEQRKAKEKADAA